MIKGLETNEIKNSIEIQLENEINQIIRFNEIARLIFVRYRNIPSEKLQILVYDFLDSLKVLNELYAKKETGDAVKNL